MPQQIDSLIRYERISTTTDVDRLIARIINRERAYPIVLISTPNKSLIPRIDIERVAIGVRRKAPVFLIPTGDLTWKLTETGPVSVFGGAGCVIPLPPRTGRIRTMQLRFAYNPEDAEVAADQLIDDVISITGAPPAQSAPALVTPRVPVATGTRRPVPSPMPSRSKPLPVAVAPVQLTMPIAIPPKPIPAHHSTDKLIGDLRLELKRAELKISELRDDLSRARVETKEAIRAGLADIEAENINLRRKLTTQLSRTAPKKKSSTKSDSKEEGDVIQAALFPNLDDAIRHSIHLAWVSRIPASDKESTPLVDYDLGPEFGPSLMAMTDQHQLKGLKAAVDVITDTAKSIATRRLHVLRTSAVSGAPPYTRSDDAICYRVNIETGTASARRLHFWKMPSGRVELIRVVTHDEVTP